MNEQTTLKEFIADWLETSVRTNVRLSTYGVYRGNAENHIYEPIGGVALGDLRKERLQRFIGELKKLHELAPRTIRAIMIMLKTALNEAVDYGYIDKNPCERLRFPKDEQREVIVFSQDEQKRIESAILSSNDNRDMGVLIMLYTGLRLGELSALRWTQINIAERTLTVSVSLKRVANYDKSRSKTSLIESSPKTAKSRRVIHLPDFLCDKLAEVRADAISEYVVSMKSGKRVEPRTMQFVYKRLLERAGVEHKKLHATRHAFATRSLEVGVDVKR
jgi:integrase